MDHGQSQQRRSFINKPQDLILQCWFSFKDKNILHPTPIPRCLLGRVWVQRPSRRAASLTCRDLGLWWIHSHIPWSLALAGLLASTGNWGFSRLAIRATSLYCQALIGQVAGASLRLLNNSDRLVPVWSRGAGGGEVGIRVHGAAWRCTG